MSETKKHIFALYSQDLKPVEQQLEIADKDLWHRITHILRLKPEEKVILFDGKQEVSLELSEKTFSGKNKIIGLVHSVQASSPIKPPITLMPSVLKREAFESVVYFAAQMGATTIQPLLTTKTHRTWNTEKEQARLTKIMIAACEQSKNFCIPELKTPIDINNVTKNNFGLYFEDDGAPLFSIAQKLRTEQSASITLVFGPEGGLTTTERQHLDACDFMCCALTPTILRAQEAVAVGLGTFRSLLKQE